MVSFMERISPLEFSGILVAIFVAFILFVVWFSGRPIKEYGPMPKRYGGFGSSISGGAGS